MSFRAVVEHYSDTVTILSVERDDGAGGFSDQVHHAGEWQEAAGVRLAQAGWRVVGGWRRHGDEWHADVEPLNFS